MIKWFLSFFTTRRAVLDLTEQLIRLRAEFDALKADHTRTIEWVRTEISVITLHVENIELAQKLNSRVSTAKRETARNWSAFRQMAEQAEGVESADR